MENCMSSEYYLVGKFNKSISYLNKSYILNIIS